MECLVNAQPENENAIEINGTSFSWGVHGTEIDKEDQKKKEDGESKKEDIIALKDINLQVKKGEFICVIGKIGAGKSSLLSALCGEMLPCNEDLLEQA